MLVRDVKLKVSWRMFWLQGFMWLILIKAVMILLRLFHSLCLCYYLSWALSTLITIIFYLCFYTVCMSFFPTSFWLCLSSHLSLFPSTSLSLPGFTLTLFHSPPPVVFAVCLSSTCRHTCTFASSTPRLCGSVLSKRLPVIRDGGIALTKVRNVDRNAYRRAQQVCRFMSVEFVVGFFCLPEPIRQEQRRSSVWVGGGGSDCELVPLCS